jgi:hypothetical protein
VLRRGPQTESVWTEEVLDTLFAALFDIKRELILISELLEEPDGPEEEEVADDS